MVTTADEAFDVFISFAIEDLDAAQTFAEQLEGLGWRVFLATPGRRPGDRQAQQFLGENIKRSRNILLLWSQWVDKSEWVALEMSIVATDRATAAPDTKQRVVVVDYGGPLLPGWFRYDLACQARHVTDPESLFATSSVVGADECPPRSLVRSRHSVRRIPAIAAIIDLGAWNDLSRAALLRVGPTFSISDLRKEELSNACLARLIRDAVAIAMLLILVIVVAALVLWRWGLRFPDDWQGYVPRAVLISGSAALASLVILSLRIGVAAAVAGSLNGVAYGTLTALLAAYHGRPEPWAGGVTVGAMFGATAATALRTHALAGTPTTGFSLRWTPFVGTLIAYGVVVAGQYIAGRAVTIDTSSGYSRALFGLMVGLAVFLPIGGIAGWFAHLQIRRRFRGQAMAVGTTVWLALTAVMCAVASIVPFGNSFDPRDGAGVGLLSGAVGAGLLTILSASLTRVVGPATATPCAVALLLAIGLPILRTFPRIKADWIYAAVCISALWAFLTLGGGSAIGQRRNAGS